MVAEKASEFLETAMYDDNFDPYPYKSDTVLVLSQVELSELHRALSGFIEKSTVIECGFIGKINNQIGDLLRA